MKTLFSKHRWMQIVFGGLFILAGGLLTTIALLSLREDSDLKPDIWLTVIMASVAFIFGLVAIMSGIFSLDKKKFSSLFPLGAVAIAIGVVLVYKPSIIGEYAMLLIASFVLAFAAIEIGEAVAMIFFKQKKFWIAFFFIIGALLVAAGVISIIFADAIKAFVYVGLGICVLVFGVVEIFNGIKVAIKDKKDKKLEEPKEEVVDAEVEEKKEEPVEEAPEESVEA